MGAPLIRNLIIKVEHSDRKIPIEEVGGDVTADELLQKLADQINLPAGLPGTLTREITRQQILPHQTLDQAGIKNGETLLASFMRTGG